MLTTIRPAQDDSLVILGRAVIATTLHLAFTATQ